MERRCAARCDECGAAGIATFGAVKHSYSSRHGLDTYLQVLSGWVKSREEEAILPHPRASLGSGSKKAECES